MYQSMDGNLSPMNCIEYFDSGHYNSLQYMRPHYPEK